MVEKEKTLHDIDKLRVLIDNSPKVKELIVDEKTYLEIIKMKKKRGK
jgi:hypothetical protein